MLKHEPPGMDARQTFKVTLKVWQVENIII